MGALSSKNLESLGVMILTAPQSPEPTSEQQVTKPCIWDLTSPDLVPSPLLSLLFLRFLILMARLSSRPQHAAYFMGVKRTSKTFDLS